MQSLYSGQWIKEHLNILICGPTGIGKSYIACALGHQLVCREPSQILENPSIAAPVGLSQRRWLLSENDQPDGANGFDYFRRLGILCLDDQEDAIFWKSSMIATTEVQLLLPLNFLWKNGIRSSEIPLWLMPSSTE